MDRVSNLPDEIICHIVSFLSAKEAVFAKVLSKRWRNLFTIIPKLHFDDSEVNDGKFWWRNLFTIIPKLHFDDSEVNDGKSFKDFVDKVLAVPVSSRVRTFSLTCKHVAQYEDDISRCLRHVVKRGVLVLNLHIRVPRKGSYSSLPSEVFTCNTVTTMKLGSGFVIDSFPPDAFLPALKSLFLNSVRFYEFDGRCSFQTLLSASPVLEELVMDGIEWERWKWCCTVSSMSLQRLTIRRTEWESDEIIRLDSRGLAYDFDSISLDTPGLTYLEYSDYVPKEYPFVNLNSLVEAKLNLCAEDDNAWSSDADTFNPVNLINGIRNVEILNFTIQAVEMFSVFSESIPVFEKVSQITLDLYTFCWFSLPSVMKKFPNLKTLIFEHSLNHGYGDDELVCECVSEYSFLLSCPVEVLKINQYSGSTRELEQMKHFLGKLSCLELVEVRAQIRAQASSDKKLQIMSDLLMLPRASNKCEIQVKFPRRSY